MPIYLANIITPQLLLYEKNRRRVLFLKKCVPPSNEAGISRPSQTPPLRGHDSVSANYVSNSIRWASRAAVMVHVRLIKT